MSILASTAPAAPRMHLADAALSGATRPMGDTGLLPRRVRQVCHLATIVLASVLSIVAALRWSANVHDVIFIWPVSGVLMALILPRWGESLRSRLAMLSAAGAGIVLGGLAADMPGWLALQTSALILIDLCLTSLLLVPATATFEGLKQRSGVVRFALTAIFVPLCTAVMGAPPLASFLHQSVARAASQTFFSNSLGMALLYPSALFLLTAPPGSVRAILSRLQAWLAVSFFLVVTCGVFWQTSMPFLFVVFPPMIVVLLVMGLEGAVVVSLLLSAIGWFATMHGHGPLWLMHTADANDRMLVLQLFVWMCLATAMPVGALLDERRRAERTGEEARIIYQIMLNHAEEMIVLSSLDASVDARYVSPSVERLSGFTPAEYLAFDRLETMHPDDRDMATTALQSLHAGKWQHTLHYRMLQKTGGHKWVEATIRAYGDEALGVVRGYVAAIRDISAQRQTQLQWEEERAALTLEQKRLTGLASTDALTGLPNRRAFEELLRQHEFDMCQQAEHVLAVNRAYTVGLRKLTILMLDVDFFKLYNDTYGHAEGDCCLRELADVLRKTLSRKDDVVARLGGEEFAVVLPGAGETAAMRVAERLLDAVRKAARPHRASPLGHVTISIGVAVALPSTDFRYAHLLQQADRALYLSKGSGKNCASLNYLHV